MRLSIHLPKTGFLACIVLAGCGHQHAAPATMPVTEATGQHWMHNEQLQKMMDQISGLRGAFPKGLPEGVESPSGKEARGKLNDMAALAQALATSAQIIPATIQERQMSDQDRHTFLAEALRLHDQAMVLANTAHRGKIEPLQGMLDSINATCVNCHSRFRDLTGDLDTHRASLEAHNQALLARR